MINLTTSSKFHFSRDYSGLAFDVGSRSIIVPCLNSAFTSVVRSNFSHFRFVHCKDCDRKMHKICVLHMEAIWPEGFICNICVKASQSKKKENRYTAKSKWNDGVECAGVVHVVECRLILKFRKTYFSLYFSLLVMNVKELPKCDLPILI